MIKNRCTTGILCCIVKGKEMYARIIMPSSELRYMEKKEQKNVYKGNYKETMQSVN